jgi:alkyl sulfatase BDS1-like metallo-beta-lactamase superfamily hydrolase
MKILMLRNAAASYGCKLSEGETGDVDKELADTLIARGIAVPGEIKAVPEKTSGKPSTKPTTAE